MVSRIINMIGGIIVTLLGIRLLLVLFGANASNPFVNFVYSSSLPFVRPFASILGINPTAGTRFEFDTLVALIVYALATALLSSMLSFGRRTTYY